MKTDKSRDIVWISGALVESVNEQTASTEDVTVGNRERTELGISTLTCVCWRGADNSYKHPTFYRVSHGLNFKSSLRAL